MVSPEQRFHLPDDIAQRLRSGRRLAELTDEMSDFLSGAADLTAQARVPSDATFLKLRDSTTSFVDVARCADLIAVTAFRPTAALVAQVLRLPRLRWLALNHVRRCSLEPLRGHAGLTHLGARWLQAHEDLGFLEGMTNLRRLSLQDFTRLRLETLPDLPRLEELSISGSITIPTLEPLARLEGLRELTVASIRVRDGSLSWLRGLTALERVSIAGSFALEECAGLAAALPRATGSILRPFRGAPVDLSLPGAPWAPVGGHFGCAKCGALKVETTGKPSRMLCTTCDFAKVQAHVERWEKAKREALR